MTAIRMTLVAFAAALLAGTSVPAAAQNAGRLPHTPRAIGKPTHPPVVPSMIVLNARGARLENGKLALEGVSPNAIVFADRPVRSAGHALTAHLLEEWGSEAPDSYGRNPPNATVSVFSKARKGVVDAVVVLKSPRLEGSRLTFDVDVLEGDLAGADGAASLFLDIINLPVPRRTAHRSAFYHGSH